MPARHCRPIGSHISLVGALLLAMSSCSRDSLPPTKPLPQSSTPAATQTALLFGKPPPGMTRIAFVCDDSGSMLTSSSTLKRELVRSIDSLPPDHSFGIFFMLSTTCTKFAPALASATAENKGRAHEFVEDRFGAPGETDAVPALEAAFSQKPQLIYLLTDGDFPDNLPVLHRLRELNADHRVVVNTVAFVRKDIATRSFLDFMRQVASENGGMLRHVDPDEIDP